MEKMMGVMVDCSRNGVLTVESVKRYADIIKKMGYNTLMLYTEDTYEIDNNPFFGHLRGRYSKQELKELNKYCGEIGIELIPCIQTLAHLNCIFKWHSAYGPVKDCDDILLCEEEKTYELIEEMFKSLAECFTSRKIHIGMDEAYNVGLGKYLQINGMKDRFDIINNHLHKVCEIADKYGFEPMIWSDMFSKLAMGTENQYADVDTSAIKEKAQLPEKISLVYWDYYSKDYDHYTRMIRTNKLFGRKVYFAGGAWTWSGFSPRNQFSIDTTEPAVKACAEEGIDGILITVWGDDGAECSPFAILPSLMFAAECAKGNTDMESIKAKFKEITGSDFDSFMLLDKLSTPGGKHQTRADRYLLYNDMFMGMRDYMCDFKDADYYKAVAEEIKNAEGKGEYKYIFDVCHALAEVLAIKSTIGIRTREAYLNRDMVKLKEIVADCDEMIIRIKNFHKLHQARWFKDYKPHGFDVQDLRIGALLQRTESCKNRLEMLINGEIEEIPELDEPVLEERYTTNTWARTVTPNVLSHVC